MVAALYVHCKYIADMMDDERVKRLELRRVPNTEYRPTVYLIGTGSKSKGHCYVYGVAAVGPSVSMDVQELAKPDMMDVTRVEPSDVLSYAGARTHLHCWPLDSAILFDEPVRLASKRGCVVWRDLTETEAAACSQAALNQAGPTSRRRLLAGLRQASKVLRRPPSFKVMRNGKR